ncbi:MAG: CRTAC1 family protein [Deltaproteobacteria bacterium]|nr:CRTAC1 family protein [Deltaproteobacteria bacterium]
MEVTAAAGLSFVHDNGATGRHHYVETMGPGVALFDADGDGDLDLYVVNGGPLPGGEPEKVSRNRFFANRGDGTFEDRTEASGAGETSYGMGVAVADIDGDEDLDLYLLNYGPNVLLRNDGSGRFEEVSVGVEDPSWSVSGAFFDFEGDGDLDLYVVNYLDYDVEKEKPCRAGPLEIYCSPEQFPAVGDRLYRNDGGRFVDVSRSAGVVRDGRGMGAAVGDLNGDGKTDIYVTNDRSHNLLYLNQGGKLDEVAAESGVGYGPTGLAEGGMGVALGDFLGTGQAAIFMTNFQKEPNRLYVDAGGGFFDDATFRSGLGFPSSELVGWGIGVLDLEGDGDLDLAVGNGHVFENAEEFIPGSAFALPDQLFVNGGDGRFEVSSFPGTPYSSRGLAVGDLDGDGDQDLVTASCGGPLQLWRNDSGISDRFLLLELRGEGANTFATGAKVTVTVGEHQYRREVGSAGSYASHSDMRLSLGLGDREVVERIEVQWPDGTVESQESLAAGHRVLWRQGKGVISSEPLQGTARLGGES